MGLSRAARHALATVVLIVATGDARATDPPPPGRAAVVDLLRRAATQDDGPARRMLASLLEGPDVPGTEALRLYLAAERSADTRASERLARLRERGVAVPFALAADDALPEAGSLVPGTSSDDPLAPGYHCHVLRGGQMWCHSGID